MAVAPAKPPLGGDVAPGFGPVADEFRRNFRDRGELGAACAVYLAGEKVVDLWGGYRDRAERSPWAEDTLVIVYSTSKGLSAATVALAHSRGYIDYDERVSAYWPEFAQNGKERITVRQLLAHQGGLCAIDEPLDAAILGDLDRVAAAIAKQRPAWEPGTRQGYHALSLGFYEGELMRRVDPRHRSLGRFFAEEIAGPLGVEFYFGLPDEIPDDRVAQVRAYRRAEVLLHMDVMPRGMVLGFVRRGSLTYRAFGNPRLRGPADLAARRFLAVELPAATGVGAPRAVAAVYGELATGGQAVGYADATLDELSAPPSTPSGGAHDLVLRVETAFSLGFLRPSPLFRFGATDRAYGHTGAGGSFGFADPDLGLGFAYAPNRLGFHLRDDPREKALRDAVYAAIGQRERAPA
ncbi:MAG: beta-lactamase family protein [Actinobacteria bacterium]|nr:beta-lactamase family protein [Actinomycetota bacterium]